MQSTKLEWWKKLGNKFGYDIGVVEKIGNKFACVAPCPYFGGGKQTVQSILEGRVKRTWQFETALGCCLTHAKLLDTISPQPQNKKDLSKTVRPRLSTKHMCRLNSTRIVIKCAPNMSKCRSH